MNINLRVENVGNIQLTPDYWDCECQHNYIHKKDEITCRICNAFLENQPDSRVDEVKQIERLTVN